MTSGCHPRRFRASVAAACLAIAACLGCASQSKGWKFASWDVREAVGLKKEAEKPQPQAPARMVATWADTTLTKVGEKPTRGFGGRLSFFGRDSEDPVRVEGELVVYAFDETSRPAHETQPTRKYIFPAEEFLRHESESKLGPSYSFWLPWDEVGSPQRKISLIARFQPKEGPIVLSEQTRHLLPGPTDPPRDGPMMAATERSALVDSVRQASFAATAREQGEPQVAPGPATPPAAKPTMATATIPLPQRWATNGQQAAAPGDSQARANLPLSQLAEHSGPSSGPAEAVLADNRAAPTTALAVNAPAVAAERRSQAATAGRAAAPGSLRDSLLETLPAQARQAAQRAPARAR